MKWSEALRTLLAKFCHRRSENALNLDESVCCWYSRKEKESKRSAQFRRQPLCIIARRLQFWHKVNQRRLEGRKLLWRFFKFCNAVLRLILNVPCAVCKIMCVYWAFIVTYFRKVILFISKYLLDQRIYFRNLEL